MRKHVFISAAVAVMVVAATACQTGVTMWSACTVAADGNRSGTDGQYVLECRDGTWVPVMTVDEFVRASRGEHLTIGPLPQRPQVEGIVLEREPTTTTTTSTSTSTSTTTTTTTTLAPRAPVAEIDAYSVAIGGTVTGNVLINDDLGNPAGSVSLVVWAGGSAQPGDPAAQPLGIMTMQADGSFVFQNTGIPAGSRIFYNYRLTNSLGTSIGVLSFSGG